MAGGIASCLLYFSGLFSRFHVIENTNVVVASRNMKLNRESKAVSGLDWSELVLVKMSAGILSSNSFYEEIYQSSEPGA